MLQIVLPVFDPAIVSVGNFELRWYSLAYIAGILLGLWLAKRINRTKAKPLSNAVFDDWIVYAVLGIVIGGRIGYTLFYNFAYYIRNPLEILAVWEGGMSFHGGLIGAVVAIVLLARKHKIHFVELMDIVAVITPIGIFLGRLANFINMELYGRITNAPWGVVFPNAGVFARHPSQLYEAFLEGALLLAVMLILVKRTKLLDRHYFFSGFFLIGYSLARIFSEIFREPDVQLGVFFDSITMGQILCVPMIIVGGWCIWIGRTGKK
jgi:phosphatidylglycerol:prolipoprotein diacylglycerol transferase